MPQKPPTKSAIDKPARGRRTSDLIAANNGIFYYSPQAVTGDDLVARMAPEQWSYGSWFAGRRRSQARSIARICHQVFQESEGQELDERTIEKRCVAKVRKVYGAFPLLLLLPVVIQIVEFLWRLFVAWQKKKLELQEKEKEKEKPSPAPSLKRDT